jgi:hypothetical protein
MKTRTGFVSNSSSSSFIILVNKNKDVCSHCGRRDPEILDIIENAGGDCCDDTQLRARGADAIERYYSDNDWYTDEEKEENAKLLSLLKAAEAKGDKEAAFIRVSYHDETTRSFMDSMVKNGTLQIMQDNED